MRNMHRQLDSDPKPTTWHGAPVRSWQGRLAEVREQIPQFERRCFSILQSDSNRSALNSRMDTIVRMPFKCDPDCIPIGTVSKDYILMPHTTVVDEATKAFAAAQIDPADVKAELKITEYGERMTLSLYFPEKYSFDPGDGHPMVLRLECLNSVDGSTRFRALMGWFRFVCSNGLIIGVTRSNVRRRHIGNFGLQQVSKVLLLGLTEWDTEKRNLERWRNKPISLDHLAPWVDKYLRKGWGFKAATRAFNIARCGSDVAIIGKFKNRTPATITVRETAHVPGAPQRCRNLFDVSQILAWLAKERRDIQEQLEWREQIPKLMQSLN